MPGRRCCQRILPRRNLSSFRGRRARPARSNTAQHRDGALLGYSVHPRPDREPGRRGSLAAISDPRQLAVEGRPGVDRPIHADAVHGRGMGRPNPVDSSPPTPKPNSAGPSPGAGGRVRRSWLARDRHPRPPGSGHLRGLETGLVGAGETGACPPAGLLPRAPLAAPHPPCPCRSAPGPCRRRSRRAKALDHLASQRHWCRVQSIVAFDRGSDHRPPAAGLRMGPPRTTRTTLPAHSFAILDTARG